MRRSLMMSMILFGSALASSFAGFSIKPYGDQNIDLVTGITSLPKGGVVNDRANGITIDAQWLEVKDGEFLRAKEVKLTATQGAILLADQLDYRVKDKSLTANGDIHYTDKNVKDVVAKNIFLDLKNNVLLVKGGVSSKEPNMRANSLVVDYDSKQALVIGNYMYNYGKTKLSSKSDKTMLLLKWNDKGDPSVTSKPTAAQLAPFKKYVP